MYNSDGLKTKISQVVQNDFVVVLCLGKALT